MLPFKKQNELVFASWLIVCAIAVFPVYASSDNYVDSLKNITLTTNNDTFRLDAYTDLTLYFRGNNPDSAKYYADLGIEKSAKLIDTDEYFILATIRSGLYTITGEHSKSIELSLQYLNYCDSTGHLEKASKCLTDLGETCRAATQFEHGIEYLERAIRICKERNLKERLINAYNRMSAIYFEMSKHDLATKYADSSIAAGKRFGIDAYIENDLDLLGAIARHAEDYAKAKDYFLQSINYDGKVDENDVNTILNLGRMYFYSDQLDSAFEYVDYVYRYATKVHIPIYIENAGNMLAIIYANNQQYDSAYNILQNTSIIRNDMFNVEKASIQSAAMADQKKLKLENDLETQKLKTKQEQIINVYLLIILAVFAIAVILSVISFSNVRKKNHQLKLKNEEINSQNEEIQSIASELEKVNTTKDKFFSIIAHDLKSPFNVLLGMSDLLVKEIDDLNKKDISKLSKAIYNTSRKTYDLLTNLLDWSRSQTNKLEYNPGRININTLILEEIDSSYELLKKKSNELKFENDPQLYVFIDENMIRAVFRNLISNANKFTSEGIIEIKLRKENDFCFVSVSDTGIGLDEQNLSKIFRLDEHTSTRGTDGEEGTGLGLVLCKEFINYHSGDIKAESKPGSGATFTFSVPLDSNYL